MCGIRKRGLQNLRLHRALLRLTNLDGTVMAPLKGTLNCKPQVTLNGALKDSERHRRGHPDRFDGVGVSCFRAL